MHKSIKFKKKTAGTLNWPTTQLKTKIKKNSWKGFYKLLNKAVFGKKKQSIWNDGAIRVVSPKKGNYLVSKQNLELN